MEKKDKKTVLKEKRFMRRITIVSAIMLTIIIATQNIGYSQDKKMTLKEKEDAWRAERLKKRAKSERMEFVNDSIQHAQAIIAIRNGSWALEASNITFNNGATNFVTPSTNYVSINDGTGTIQTAFDNTNVYSPNGLGGITLQGNITNEELYADQDNNVHYNYLIQGNNVSATINIVISANSNQATANIIPNFSSRSMLMSGYIYPYNEAGVFEGTPDY